MTSVQRIAIALFGLLFAADTAASEPGNASRGQRVFGACVACHSLEPNRNMTGPSLAGVWNRKAGTLPSFPRYSHALKSSGLVWDDKTLEEYLTDPQYFIPGNTMTFPGIKDAQQRADLLAFLEEATQPGRAPSLQSAQQDAPMGGMMGSRPVPNLKTLDPAQRVQSIRICRDTYQVTTANGVTRDFWERNLRFKTDSSDEGPQTGAPAILRAGMMGDRASVIFAAPGEISRFISSVC